MTTNGMKPCVSLVNDANAVEDAAMVFFLVDRKWVEQVHVHCVGGSFVEMELVDDAMKTRADLLAKLIQ